jgi:hypothetical protein
MQTKSSGHKDLQSRYKEFAEMTSTIKIVEGMGLSTQPEA